MIRVIAVVEGSTEKAFVLQVLAPWLAMRGVALSARVVGKPGHKGGIGEWSRAKRDIIALLKQEPTTIVTTMFDFYGMPTSWPGRAQAANGTQCERPTLVETAIAIDIAATLGNSFDRRRVIPYVQMHEFEALLFSAPKIIAEVVCAPTIADQLAAVRTAFATPEEINDNPNTAPSKRLVGIHRGYQKVLHGAIAAKRIGVAAMCAECPHFGEWVTKLEALATPSCPH